MHTKDEIKQILNRLEGEEADALENDELEFKAWEQDSRALQRVLRETVVCLANARGGTLVLGVRDRVRSRSKAIQGVGTYDISLLRRSIYDGTEPHILVEIEELKEPEGTLLLIHIPKGIPPHTTSDGVARIRIGKECKPLTGHVLTQLLASGGQRDPTAEIIPGLTESALDQNEVSYMKKIIDREAQSKELVKLDDRSLLKAMELITQEGNITLSGLLLIGKAAAISQYVPQHEVTFLRYKTHTRYDQRKDLRGPLLAVLREMEQLVSVNNRIKTLQEEGFGQMEFPDLSWEVAREAILNAMTHRDYFLRQSIQISLYKDFLEIINPGGFVGGISAENILRHPPVHRNELLARAFQIIGLINRVGLGVDRIYEGLLRLGKDIPKYTADEAHVRLMIPLVTHNPFAVLVSSETRKGVELDLDDLLILRAFTRTSHIDRWSAATLLQIPEEEAAEKLVSMREKGYLIVRGRGRGASYDLKRELADKLRGESAVNSDFELDEEGVRLRILHLLDERGHLTNAEIRQFSGFSRLQVYHLVKILEKEGKIQFSGKGRGTHIIPQR